MRLAIDQIIVSKDNPRKNFDEEKLAELGESIERHGLLQPIVVRPKGNLYELVVGERRFRSAQNKGLTTIEVIVRNLDNKQCKFFRIIENTQREDLTEAEKGNAIANMLLEYPELTIGDIAKIVTRHEVTVNQWLQQSERLSDLVKKSIPRNKLSSHGVRLLVKFSHEEQNKLAHAIIQYKIKKGHDDKHVEFIKKYALNPEKYPTVESLEDLANEIKGIKKVKIDLSKLSPEARAEVQRKIDEAKKEADEAKKRRKKRNPPRKRVNRRKQGRPKNKKTKPKEKTDPEKKPPIPKPTIPTETQTITVALSFPEPLWEKLHRYMAKTNKPMLLEDVIIELLNSHPLLGGI